MIKIKLKSGKITCIKPATPNNKPKEYLEGITGLKYSAKHNDIAETADMLTAYLSKNSKDDKTRIQVIMAGELVIGKWLADDYRGNVFTTEEGAIIVYVCADKEHFIIDCGAILNNAMSGEFWAKCAFQPVKTIGDDSGILNNINEIVIDSPKNLISGEKQIKLGNGKIIPIKPATLTGVPKKYLAKIMKSREGFPALVFYGMSMLEIASNLHQLDPKEKDYTDLFITAQFIAGKFLAEKVNGAVYNTEKGEIIVYVPDLFGHYILDCKILAENLISGKTNIKMAVKRVETISNEFVASAN